MAERKTWNERERLVLEAVLDIEEQVLAGERDDDHGMLPDTPSVVASLEGQLSDREVTSSIALLIRSGYLSGHEQPGLGRSDHDSLSLTEKSRVLVGTWPGAGDPVGTLIDVLAAREEQEEDPEVRNRLRRAREGVAGLVGHIGREVLTAYAKAGLPGIT
jgi:hypothetical protein